MDLRLPVDGVMGAETRGAIRSFQRREGLPEDGIAGPQVEAALVRLSQSRSPEEEPSDDTSEEEGFLSQGRNWRRGGSRPKRMLQQFSDEPLQEEIDPESPDHVQWLQRSLNRVRGLDLLEDGVHGPVTRSALRNFQKQHGLTPSGVLNLRTEGALMASGATQHRHPKRHYDAGPLELYPELNEFETIGTTLTSEMWEGEMNRGSRDYVRWVQQSLNRLLGLGLAVDGLSGPQTRSAVRSFQQQRGLAVDGVVGPQTEAALIAAGSGQPPGSSPQPNLSPSTGLPYAVAPGQPYGPHWRARLPPGLPTTARRTSVRGASVGAIQAAARGHGLGEVFVNVVSHLAQTESGATYARPANTFDARPPAERPANKSLITAWGVFQFNRDAWRALPGTSTTSFPWHASVAEEVSRPVARYAELFRQVRTAGGNELAAARGIRLWHRSPAAFRSYVRAGQSSGFDAAWRAVSEQHRTAVDRRMQEIGLTAGSQEREAGELDGWPLMRVPEFEQLNQEVSMIILSDSVGSGGANKQHDVFPVQILLNKFIIAGKLLGIGPLAVDGKIGPKTIAAIKAFQKRIVGMNNPDGRVDPGGRTLQALNGPINQPPISPSPAPSSLPSGNLKYGVPDGKIGSGYLKKRSGGYHTGIDVSTSSSPGQGADDPRRGLPVFATIRPVLDIAMLNLVQVALKKEPPWKKGLGIPGQGWATLREAQVHISGKANRVGGEYGGVVGLACRYAYTRTDGKPGVFTLYIEYWHLITPAYLPKNGQGRVLSLSEWTAAGKGNRIGVGPKMKNGAILKPSDFAAPPLVGYLGATQWPHVHIHANYKAGEQGYLFYPRFDPTVMIL